MVEFHTQSIYSILRSSDFQENAKSKIVAQVYSDPFTVYSAKKVKKTFY